ncbi:MAG: hypothetical protein AAF403_04970 [Pseudomonadota bacterium]
MLSGYKATDLTFSVNQDGKAVISFKDSSDMIVLNNVQNINDLKNNVVDFADQADKDGNNKLGVYELLDNVVDPITKQTRPSKLSNAKIVLLDEEENNFIDINPIDDTTST